MTQRRDERNVIVVRDIDLRVHTRSRLKRYFEQFGLTVGRIRIDGSRKRGGEPPRAYIYFRKPEAVARACSKNELHPPMDGGCRHLIAGCYVSVHPDDSQINTVPSRTISNSSDECFVNELMNSIFHPEVDEKISTPKSRGSQATWPDFVHEIDRFGFKIPIPPRVWAGWFGSDASGSSSRGLTRSKKSAEREHAKATKRKRRSFSLEGLLA